MMADVRAAVGATGHQPAPTRITPRWWIELALTGVMFVGASLLDFTALGETAWSWEAPPALAAWYAILIMSGWAMHLVICSWAARILVETVISIAHGIRRTVATIAYYADRL